VRRLGIDFAGLAKSLTHSLQRGLVNLAIAFDDVNSCTRAVSEGGDLLGALVPTHHSGVIEEGLSEHDGLIGGVEAILTRCQTLTGKINCRYNSNILFPRNI
jgi:hypothetical protein